MAPDGAILAMVGGRDYNESQFNRAVQAKRQPGSLFKVFVYLAAFQKGLDPQTTAVDRPVQIGNWEPENYGRRFRGQMTLRSAFAHSINSVAVQVADAIGIQAVIDTARKLGVQSELPAVPSLALGAGEVSLLEMTRAFAAIAADAESVEPYTVRAVRNGDRVLFTRQNRSFSRQAIRRRGRPFTTCWQASCAKARVARQGSTVRSRERRGRARVTRTHGSSDSPTISSWACGLAMTTTAPREASPAATCRHAFGMNSSRSRPPFGPRPPARNHEWRRCPPSRRARPSRKRTRPSFAACRWCKIPEHWRSKDAWCGCSASRVSAAAPCASSGGISQTGKWHASRPPAAVITAVASRIRISRAWCCSTAAAERARMRRQS